MEKSDRANRRFQMVDVFASDSLTGNPLPVVIDAEGLDGDQMMRITRWMNQSETTFLLPPNRPEADYRVRIFTLDRELPFAGHPTLGSCLVWLDNGGRPKGEHIIQECGAGLVSIRRDGDSLAFAAPPLLRSGAVDDDKTMEVAKVLGVPRREIRAIEWIDNGPGWIGVLMESADSVLQLQVAGSHPGRIEIGVAGPYPQGGAVALEVRAFYTDQHGVLREDPVTGSLNASMAQWLIGSGHIDSPYIAQQGTRIGHRGRIMVRQEDGEIWIGGRVISVISGHCSV